MALDLEEIGRLRRSQMLAAQADREFIRSPLRWHDACATTAMTPVRQIALHGSSSVVMAASNAWVLYVSFSATTTVSAVLRTELHLARDRRLPGFGFRTAAPECVLD